MKLEPGDLAVIVKPYGLEVREFERPLVGKLVVLIRPCAAPETLRRGWVVAGLPSWAEYVYEDALRKIPPAPLEDDSPVDTVKPVEAV